MRLDLAPVGRTLARRAVGQTIGRCALAAVGGAFAAVSINALGADIGTRYSTALGVPTQRAPVVGRQIPAYPIDPPDGKPDHSAQRARIVDQLYEELMRWTPPGCSSTGTKAAVVAGC